MTDEIAAETPSYPVLSAPADGVPPVVDTADEYRRMLDRLAAGDGPVAIDTERAQIGRAHV